VQPCGCTAVGAIYTGKKCRQCKGTHKVLAPTGIGIHTTFLTDEGASHFQWFMPFSPEATDVELRQVNTMMSLFKQHVSEADWRSIERMMDSNRPRKNSVLVYTDRKGAKDIFAYRRKVNALKATA
jgi:hypothetical protein